MAATVKAKAPAKRPARPPRPAPVSPPSTGAPSFEPPRLTTSSEPPERVVLFYIDDQAYSITRTPGVNVGLKYLHLCRTSGENEGLAYLLEKLLGAEGYRALMDYDELTSEQFQQICEIASRLTLGALEPPKA